MPNTEAVTLDEVRVLLLSWSVSRGQDTYGYNICRLDDSATRKRYRCMGGGYDMQGTVFGEWLQDTQQERLLAIADRAYYAHDVGGAAKNEDGLYGMSRYTTPPLVALDGGCGLESMIRIAEAIGLKVQRVTNQRGHLMALVVLYISGEKAPDV